MAMMMGGLYEALVKGGTSSANARKVAGEVADDQKQPAEIRTDLTLVMTLLGVIVTGVAALVIRTFLG